MKHSDIYWMRRCLLLARRGTGAVSPNPLVGAVIVKNGKKISEGYHERFGGLHAEINAIHSAIRRRKPLTGSTLYVNLEPCFHTGKTPPCVDEILRYGFSRIVIAQMDPNPLVSGKSIQKLKKHNLSCTVGVLSEEAGRLNEQFLSFITTGLPFVAVKAAQTSDGFIAREDGRSQWITNVQSRRHVHKMRIAYDCVLVGAQTVINDNPRLTVRHQHGRNPVRAVVDGKCSVPVSKKIFTSNHKTIIYVDQHEAVRHKAKLERLKQKGVDVVRLKGKDGVLNIRHILKDLAGKKIASVLVEGGQKTYASFFNAGVVKKMYLFTAKKKFITGIKTFRGISVSYTARLHSAMKFGTDILKEYDIV